MRNKGEKRKPAILVLEDGRTFKGYSFGAQGEAIGEVVFNTSMTGYQEIITDPSYKGQMVAMTYPEIGNYGVNTLDVESKQPFLEGFIVRHYNDRPSNFRSTGTLGAYLRRHRVAGIEEVDTRALTRHLRDDGAKQAIISSVDFDVKRLLKKISAVPTLVGQDLVKLVSCRRPYRWNEGQKTLSGGVLHKPSRTFKVVAYDFGIKYNILRNLVDAGCEVQVVPAKTPASQALAYNPDGIFFSNGPGDPAPVHYAVETIAHLIGKAPLFGICLGHQLLSRALGGKTFKMKFGHHGGNHPVMDLATKKVEITSQNHGFAVDMKSLQDRADVTHLNLNDKTIEGLRLKKEAVFSVQYHPEASPGPHDAHYLFQRFIEMMKGNI